jgi:Alginate export
MRPSSLLWLWLAIVSSGPARAAAQTHDATAGNDEQSTGLPPGIKWTFNFDATWGTFGFANSLFQNPRGGVRGELSDQWFEGSARPALSGMRKVASSEFYGKVSAVGERTYGAQPTALGGDASSFQFDDLFMGWRSGTALGSSENLLDFTVGRAPFTIGHGMLLSDGSAEAGSRGGYWTNARKAFQFAAIGRIHAGRHKVEAFYLDRDDLPEAETGTRLSGVNYEFAAEEHSTFGVSYLKFMADPTVLPDRNGLNVFNLRAYTSPIPSSPDISLEFEFASEWNADRLRSDAWTLQGAYEFSQAAWKPKFSYRYAAFEGDNPATPRHETFDPLLPAFYDWGVWWQGEIVGEYIAQNSNLISHVVRAHVKPTDKLDGGLMWLKFSLDQPASLSARVTSPNLASEVDAYVDWKINGNVSASFVGALANPGTALREAFARTQNFAYGMVFLTYSY